MSEHIARARKMVIPSGWRFYPLEKLAHLADAHARGIPAPRETPKGYWLPPDYRPIFDPRAARQIARQERICGGCGE